MEPIFKVIIENQNLEQGHFAGDQSVKLMIKYGITLIRLSFKNFYFLIFSCACIFF